MINHISSHLLSVNSNVVLSLNSLKKSKKVLKEPSAEDYNALALLYKNKNLNQKVIFYYHKALTFRLSSLGSVNKKTALSYLNLADALSLNGELIKANAYYLKAVEITEKLFGAEAVELAHIYAALANNYFMDEKLEMAQKFYVDSLAIRVENLGEVHPLTAQSHYDLAYFYAAEQEYTLALPLFLKSLETRVELFRNSHPLTAVAYHSLAMCYYHLFEYKKASIHLLEAIRIKELILLDDDESLVVCRKNLIVIEKQLSRTSKKVGLKKIKSFLF
jgi:tetratricopeptide (TPR) repeat protein